jgi:hypothetical protein
MAAKREFRHGRVIACYLPGRNGKREIHPAVVISADNDIIQPEQFDPRKNRDNLLAVLGISTQYLKFSDPCIRLPHQGHGNSVTGLNKDCAVILNWYAAIYIPDDCEYLLGDVPRDLMGAINNSVRNDLTVRFGSQVVTLLQLITSLKPRS